MNKSLEEILTEFSKMDVVDIMERMSGGSKSGKKWWNAKRRGCSNRDITRLCVICTQMYGKNIYGKRVCKSFKKRNNMKVGYFRSNKELMRDIIQNAMNKSL